MWYKTKFYHFFSDGIKAEEDGPLDYSRSDEEENSPEPEMNYSEPETKNSEPEMKKFKLSPPDEEITSSSGNTCH